MNFFIERLITTSDINIIPSRPSLSIPCRPAAPYPSVPAPLYRSLALLLDQGYLVVEKGWLMSMQSNLSTDQLPHWMGQITLKGVVTDRVSVHVVVYIDLWRPLPMQL